MYCLNDSANRKDEDKHRQVPDRKFWFPHDLPSWPTSLLCNITFVHFNIESNWDSRWLGIIYQSPLVSIKVTKVSGCRWHGNINEECYLKKCVMNPNWGRSLFPVLARCVECCIVDGACSSDYCNFPSQVLHLSFSNPTTIYFRDGSRAADGGWLVGTKLHQHYARPALSSTTQNSDKNRNININVKTGAVSQSTLNQFYWLAVRGHYVAQWLS